MPNLTMGPDIVAALARASGLMLDVHLMVSNPDEHIGAFAKAGARNLTFHIEVRHGEAAEDLIKQIHDLGCSAGISLNPATPVEELGPVMGQADLILVMSVVPGFTGQAFMPGVLEKLKFLRQELGARQRLAIDGGIGIRTCIRRWRRAQTCWWRGRRCFGIRSGSRRSSCCGGIIRSEQGVGLWRHGPWREGGLCRRLRM